MLYRIYSLLIFWTQFRLYFHFSLILRERFWIKPKARWDSDLITEKPKRVSWSSYSPGTSKTNFELFYFFSKHISKSKNWLMKYLTPFYHLTSDLRRQQILGYIRAPELQSDHHHGSSSHRLQLLVSIRPTSNKQRTETLRC